VHLLRRQYTIQPLVELYGGCMAVLKVCHLSSNDWGAACANSE
jgi:hypothetical protein